ncbi:MAG: MBOAT family O-acyltransferase [Lachnospiraceae bacterium]|nr:MBOAT family O-acyltransferase [Lachnospiraceae bacterium]
MVFSSLLFLFRFLPVMMILYFAAPKGLRNGILFLGSLIFYGWGEPVYVSLLLFSTVVDYAHGRLIGYVREKGRPELGKWLVASSACINLALLGVFKYADFFIGLVNETAGSQIPLPGLALPIGISFYTFQTMSYTIDVYRNEAKIQKNIISFGAYVAMFPQLIAGPIVRYQTIAEELDERRESFPLFSYGVRMFVIGLMKKVLIANPMGALWTEVQGIGGDERSVLLVWMGILAFAMQIYYDFSGYSDMAVGLGSMFGFHFPENFHYPYLAKSITDFWRRWHISLGTWFKEYVYIPLGGNRKGRGKQLRNILIVWILTGIWHGAAANFCLWGLYFGVLLLVEKFCLKKYLEKLPAWFQHMYAMLLVLFGWVLFAHEDLGAGLRFGKEMIGLGGIAVTSPRSVYLLVSCLPLFVLAVIGSTEIPKRIGNRIFGGMPAEENVQAAGIAAVNGRLQTGSAARWTGLAETVLLLAGILLCTAYLVNDSYNPFLYFRF